MVVIEARGELYPAETPDAMKEEPVVRPAWPPTVQEGPSRAAVQSAPTHRQTAVQCWKRGPPKGSSAVRSHFTDRQLGTDTGTYV